MLLPIFPLVIWRTVLHEFTLAAQVSVYFHIRRILGAILRSFRTATGAHPTRRDFPKADVTFNPIAHVLDLGPPPAFLGFDLEQRRCLEASPGKANDFAIVHAGRIRTSGRIIEEQFLVWDKKWIREKYL
jgi:hypothetical protein